MIRDAAFKGAITSLYWIDIVNRADVPVKQTL